MEVLPIEIRHEIIKKCRKIDYSNLILTCKNYYRYIINNATTTLDSDNKFVNAYKTGDILTCHERQLRISIIHSYEIWVTNTSNDTIFEINYSTKYVQIVEYIYYYKTYKRKYLYELLVDSCLKNHTKTFMYIINKEDILKMDLQYINMFLYYSYMNKNYDIINYIIDKYQMFEKNIIINRNNIDEKY